MNPAPLQEPSRNGTGRWYWSIRPEHGVPERIGTNALWGRFYDSRSEAIAAYKDAEVLFGTPK